MDGLLKQAQGALGSGALGGLGGAAPQQQQQQQTQQTQQQGQEGQQQQQQGQTQQQGSTSAPAAGQATGQQDALDKGVAAVLSRAGYAQDAATTEKISDGVRSAFKSVTGRDIPIQDKQ